MHQKLVEEKVFNKESQPASLNVETSKRDDFAGDDFAGDDFAENKAVFRVYEAPSFNLRQFSGQFCSTSDSLN